MGRAKRKKKKKLCLGGQVRPKTDRAGKAIFVSCLLWKAMAIGSTMNRLFGFAAGSTDNTLRNLFQTAA